MLLCFFVEQKTSYELLISDWSSDLCSSDLADPRIAVRIAGRVAGNGSPAVDRLPRPGLGTGLPGVPPQQPRRADPQPLAGPRTDPPALLGALAAPRRQPAGVRRSAERRGGKVGGSTFRSRCSPMH